jgi:predicted metal-dependent phosphoesterase TrpH
MKQIDLHVHSNISDGTFSPAEVTTLAHEAGLAAFALTDHDTTAGVAEAIDTAKQWEDTEQPLEVVPGVEISVGYKDRDIHMLGLMIDYNDKELVSVLEHIQNERLTRNRKMAKNLADAGIDISMEKLEAQEEPGTVLTRAHFAKYLVAHGYAKNRKEAFAKYLEINGPYYVTRSYISPKHAIALIRNAGGIPILAHPLLYKLSMDELESLVKQLASDGLGGLEAIYSSNQGYDEQNMKHLAERYHLAISGGTDFHGKNKPHLQIGVGRGNMKISYEILGDLRKMLV